MDAALTDPAGQLEVASSALLDLFPAHQVTATFETLFRNKLEPRLQHFVFAPFEAAGSASGMAKYFAKNVERGLETNKRNTLCS
jgi:hypothetical protein